MDGLEIKVQLDNVWKQSLTELSGGQRCAPHRITL
jgi:chromosome segregation ATPase